MSPGTLAHRRLRRNLGALVTTALGLILVLFIAGPWIMLATVVLICAWLLAGIQWFGTPEQDAYCSRVDEEWDRASRAGERARQRARREARRRAA